MCSLLYSIHLQVRVFLVVVIVPVPVPVAVVAVVVVVLVVAVILSVGGFLVGFFFGFVFAIYRGEREVRTRATSAQKPSPRTGKCFMMVKGRHVERHGVRNRIRAPDAPLLSVLPVGVATDDSKKTPVWGFSLWGKAPPPQNPRLDDELAGGFDVHALARRGWDRLRTPSGRKFVVVRRETRDAV